jgi:hypothetical protein
VFLNATEHLSLCFCLAYSTPCYSNQLLNNIGHLGDTQCTLDIFDGLYIFPPNTDPWTIKILQEVHYTFKMLSNEPINTTISVLNFLSYWQGANESTSSSYFHLHFGHYKATSFDKDLSALHATKLSACTNWGVPLSHWGVGLTILLEKTLGNNNIHNMRAVRLLKGNFNYYNKLIFDQHMMKLAQPKGQVPIECFATKGRNCINAVMTKIMLCNESQTHHHPTCIGGNNFGNCYDRVMHPPLA